MHKLIYIIVLLPILNIAAQNNTISDSTKWFTFFHDELAGINILIDSEITNLSDTCECDDLYLVYFGLEVQFDTCQNQFFLKKLDVKAYMIKIINKEEGPSRRIFLQIDTVIQKEDDCLLNNFLLVKRLEDNIKDKMMHSNFKTNMIVNKDFDNLKFFLDDRKFVIDRSSYFRCVK